MKNVRRRLKKRNRAQNFDELEEALFMLLLKHNLLVKSHRKLQGKCINIQSVVDDIEVERIRSYGL